MQDYLTNQKKVEQQLPNAIATLVLGILSIVVCFVCGIVALVISNRDLEMYKNNPESFTIASYNNIKAGRICAIVGVCLQIVGAIIYCFFLYFFFNNMDKFRPNY
jgi:phosphotransferase system  glucose/maltose/N-acetylglucosamine-specific IIC component